VFATCDYCSSCGRCVLCGSKNLVKRKLSVPRCERCGRSVRNGSTKFDGFMKAVS
jgi:hypothetical protein